MTMQRVNLNELDDDQRAAATAPRGPVAILAGAGTGKTRTITYRIAHLIDQGLASPNRILAVTFTRRAAAEMRHRLQLMGAGGVQAQTFHSAALRQLRYFWPQLAGDLPWKILDNKYAIVARATRSVGIDASPENVRDLMAEVEWAKARLFSPDQYVEALGQRTPPHPKEKVAEIYRRYEQYKTSPEGMLLDFDDLLLHTAGALENSPGIAEEFREQYRTFVVDEYQDVTPLQQRVLDGWLGGRDDLTVVGDANQTIYSFTGATPDYLLNFSRKYPHAAVVKLQRNYRSTRPVTDFANAVIAKASGRVAGTKLTLQGMRPGGGLPHFEEFDSEPQEARGVAQRIKELQKQGVQLKDIAVLYRMNSQSEAFEQALAEAGITYQVRGGEKFFERPEVREAMGRILKAQQQGAVAPVVGPNLAGVVKQILAPLGLGSAEPEGARAKERWHALNALVDLIEELGRATPDMGFEQMIEALRERASNQHPPSMQGVTLASLHAAKGLEWQAVFLVGLVEGTLPITHAIKADQEAIEEERRLFYVGVTRSQEHLYCSWSKARQEGAKASRKRTRFLDGFVADAKPLGVVDRTRRRRTCRVCGDTLHSPAEKTMGRCEDCPGGNDEVFEALRAWRSDVAREMNAPAYMVFTDATLHAIAEALPTTNEGLLAISGVGPVKVQKFGEGILEITRQFA